MLAFSLNQHNITTLFCPIISLFWNMSAHTTFLQTPPAYLTIFLLSIWNPYLSFKLMCQYCRLTFRRADGELGAKLLSVITGLPRFISLRAQWMFSFSTVLGKTALRNRWQKNCAGNTLKLSGCRNRFFVAGPFVGSYFVVAPGRYPPQYRSSSAK